jgi:hypothetical protein
MDPEAVSLLIFFPRLPYQSFQSLKAFNLQTLSFVVQKMN